MEIWITFNFVLWMEISLRTRNLFIVTIGEGEHICSICKKVFAQKEYLLKHVKQLHSAPSYVCDNCNESFPNSHNLKRHVESLHQNVSHCCKICGKNYSRKDKLKAHYEHKQMYTIFANVNRAISVGAIKTSTPRIVPGHPRTMYPVCPGSEGTLYPVCPGTMYPHCPSWRTVIGCHRFPGL